MKRSAIAFALLLVASCSSGTRIAKPEILLVQVYAPTDAGYARGTSSLMAQFAFRVTNRANEQITLRRVQLESVGGGGYYLRREDRSFKHQIGVGQTIEDTMQARAYFSTTLSGTASTEPVTIRALFYFESPAGSFRQIVLRNISQFSEGPR